MQRLLLLLLVMAGTAWTWNPLKGELVSPAMIVNNLASKLIWRIALEVGLLELSGNQTNPLNMDQNLAIIQQIHKLSDELHNSQISMTEILSQRMHDVVEGAHQRNRFIGRLERLYALVRLVERRERSMNELLREGAPRVEQLTLTQFALAAIDVSKTDSVIELMHELEMLVTGSNLVSLPPGRQDIFSQLNERWHARRSKIARGSERDRATAYADDAVTRLGLLTLLLWLVLAALAYPGASAGKLTGASPIDALRVRYLEQERRAWTIANHIDTVDNQLEQDATQQRAVVMRELVDIYLHFIEAEIPAKDLGDYRLLQRLSEWAMLEKNVLTVNNLFDVLYSFLHEHAPHFTEQAELGTTSPATSAGGEEDLRLLTIDLAETILFGKREPIELQLDQIYTIMVRQALYYRASMTASSVLCSFGLSPQQMIYVLYESIAMTELKGYIMMQFSYMLLKTQGKGNFTVESQARRDELQTRLNRTQQLLQSVMRQTSGDYWRCDPEPGSHRENTTYVQFTRLLQGYVENEVDMNVESTCRESCAHYQYGHEQHQCYKELYCSQQPKCAGRIYDCEYIDSDMWICPAAPGSQRRYEYIEYENGELRGRKQHCPRGTSKVDSWWRWLFWHCSYCFCLCDDAGRHSDRYVSLRESVSDIGANRVVTGLRFVKQKQMVHLIVQQGLLLPGGDIANDTLEWVTAKPFSHTDKGVRDGQDYHMLTYDRRSIDLDDVHVHPGYVLTGVRFRTLGTHLNLEIRMTEMNFTTGQLIDPNKSIWIGNEGMKRTEISLRYMDVPTLAPAKSIPDSTSGQYLRFGPTGGRLDAAQTTIPFLDAQPVYTVRPTPLSGAGLYHKALSKYGGFVGPKLFTYDFGPHIQVPTDDWFAAELQGRHTG
uniref:Uncharacterized protein n=1 Tax=Anopheles dirus TaxID=7168 RepID=A0A182N8H5_9DIPT